MKPFLAIQNTYDQLELGLFQGNALIASKQTPKFKATSLFIPLLQELLRERTLSFADVSFIAVNQGPGPFSTLRVVIASVNGLQFVTGIPLIGINALQALASEYDQAPPFVLILLNAFGSDVYYGFSKNGAVIETGCDTAEKVLDLVVKQTTEQIVCVGNAVPLYQKEINRILGKQAVIQQPTPPYSSLSSIGQIGLERWNNQEQIEKQLMPIYLKKAFNN